MWQAIVTELTRLFNAFALSDMEGITLKAAMTLPSLVLTKNMPRPKPVITSPVSNGD